MLLRTTFLLFCVAMGSGITPISENVRIRLQGTADGPDSRGEGFAALTEHVALWDGSDATLPEANVDVIANNAQKFRGELFQISGVVELSTRLDSPWKGTTELFVRSEAGTLFGVYVVGEYSPRVGVALRGPVVFYKVMEIEGGDGQQRSYPTFVTASAVLNASGQSAVVGNIILIIPAILLGCGVLFVVLKNKNKRAPRKRERVHSSDVIEAANETVTDLPGKASDALAAMYEEDKPI